MNKLLYPLFLLISLFLPRNKKIWIFGCYDGYLDNTKYFFEHASKRGEYTCYWLANSKSDEMKIRKIGYKSVEKNSLKGYWLSARAYISFICTGYSDVNRMLALGGKVINFWHGTPIKKIYLDSEHEMNRFGDGKINRLFFEFAFKLMISRISFYFASNELERKLVCNAARMKIEKSLAFGSPRQEKIKNPIEHDLIKKIKEQQKKIYLFAPTWRESGLWIDKYYLSSDLYLKLNDLLRFENIVLLIKNHPLTKIEEIKKWGLKPSENIVYLSDHGIKDINDIYKYADILITDLSSAAFDFSIFNRQIIYFMPDCDKYLDGNRGVYEYFANHLRDYALRDWGELIERLSLLGDDMAMNNIPLLETSGVDINPNDLIYDHITKNLYSVS